MIAGGFASPRGLRLTGGREGAGRVFLLMDRILPVTVLDFNTTPPIPQITSFGGVAKRHEGGSGKPRLCRAEGAGLTISSCLKSLVEFVPQETFLSPPVGAPLLSVDFEPGWGGVKRDLSFEFELSNLS